MKLIAAITRSTLLAKVILCVLGLCLWLVFGQSLPLPPRFQVVFCGVGLVCVILLQAWVMWYGHAQGCRPRPTLGEQFVQVLGFVVIVGSIVIAAAFAPDWVIF